MHIPNSMLPGPICPVTAVVSTLGVAAAAYCAVKSKDKPSATRFGAVSALIFAGQMMNFPIQHGTSGHLLGGVLAAALLGTPFGILAIAVVLTIQCLVFSDGGFAVLGANILNMALIGAGLGGILRTRFLKTSSIKSLKDTVTLGSIAWLSVMMAAIACSIELALSGTIAFSKVVGAMLSTHALIGIGEGLITVAVCYVFAADTISSSKKWFAAAPFMAALVIAMILSPFASGYPDGLEWVAEKYQFLHDAAPSFVSPLPDYSVPLMSNEIISTGLAGLAGVLLTFFLSWMIAKVLTFYKRVEVTS